MYEFLLIIVNKTCIKLLKFLRGEIMESKGAKFVVFLVVAFIAIICSSAVYSVTGGFSDWISTDSYQNEDLNGNGYVDSSEGDNFQDDNGKSSDDNNDSGGLFDWFGSSDSSDDDSGSKSYTESGYSDESDSNDNPDLGARLIRWFMGYSSDSYDKQVSTSQYEDSDDSSSFSFSGGNDGESDVFNSISEGFDKVNNKINNKLDSMFN